MTRVYHHRVGPVPCAAPKEPALLANVSLVCGVTRTQDVDRNVLRTQTALLLKLVYDPTAATLARVLAV